MLNVFNQKLDALPSTLNLFETFDPSCLATALRQGGGRHALAVGSGGSLVAAEYFARCRDTLSLGPTSVQTPMQAVLELQGLAESEVWLFSAGGDNADISAAAQAALDRGCRRLHLVTRNEKGAAAEIARRGNGTVHLVPVADAKDGYLATHSLMASVTALLLGSDLASREPLGRDALLSLLAERLARCLEPISREEVRELFDGIRRTDTLILAADPLLRPLAVLLDTSLWEAALCPIQTTDIRNLAHGRHTWLHHRAEETFVLGLTGVDSRSSWRAIDAVLPSSIRRAALDHGSCSRLDNASALIDGFGIIEGLGVILEIDPGKPGVGDFGRSIYEAGSLAQVASRLTTSVRHKRSAMARTGGQEADCETLSSTNQERVEALLKAEIGGAVFDYDGTLVATDCRFGPPEPRIIEQIVRLHHAGVEIGIATGRGGSVGEELRSLLPPEMVGSVVVGYYNGGLLRTADVDIEHELIERHPAIEGAAAWLWTRRDLFEAHDFKVRALQITIGMDALKHPDRFVGDFSECPVLASGDLRITSSGHSYDVVPAASSKLKVVEALRVAAKPGSEILCFGDSGSRSGNDHAFLSHAFGISVGDVCDAPDGCWSLFGDRPTGPEALLRVLRSLVHSPEGRVCIDSELLALDSH